MKSSNQTEIELRKVKIFRMAIVKQSGKNVSLINLFPSIGSSINHGSRVHSLADHGLGQRFFDKLLLNKDKILQVDIINHSIETCGVILQRSLIVATDMKNRGIKENDIVVLTTKTRSEETVVLLATLFVGAILATLDSQSDLKDFQNSLVTLKPSIIFCDVRSYRQIELIKQQSGEIQCDVVIFGDRGAFSFEKILAQQTSYYDLQPVTMLNPQRSVAFIVASQGTSNQSKLVCISHTAVEVQISKFSSVILGKPEKILSFFPLHWITQLVLICYCLDSLTVRVVPGSYTKRYACRVIHDLQVDVAVLGSDNAHEIVEDVSFKDYDLTCLKYVFVGGVLTPPNMIVHLRKSFKDSLVLQCYGLTEMSGLVSGFAFDNYNAALEKPGSVGKLLPGIKFKILDLDSEKPLGPDWWGELIIKGETLMLGYYKNVNATVNSFYKCYFKTGDVAQYDSEGYFYLRGRVCDYLMMNGKRIFPQEVEVILTEHKHVMEAVVVGNEKETVACVVKNPDFTLTAEGVMRYLLERLPKNKLPTRIKFLDHLPKTTVGKIKRNFLKQAIFGVTIERVTSSESK